MSSASACDRIVMPPVVGHGAVPWRVWASRLGGLFPTERAVVGCLAGLADWRGELICSTSWMIGATGASRSSVMRALAGLEAGGALARRRRYRPAPSAGQWRGSGRSARGASLITLHAARAVPEAEEVRVARELPDFCSKGPFVGTDDDEGLRAAIAEAAEEGWEGPATGVVARSLDAATGRQLAKAVKRGVVFSSLGREESRLDTMGWAWQVLRLSEAAIVSAASPWGYWTASTKNQVGRWRDAPSPEEAFDPSMMPIEAEPLPGECDAPLVGIGEIGPVLSGAVEALVGAGVDETAAWAGMRRVAELAQSASSRAHTSAAQDPRLADLGYSPAAARRMMTLVKGSRRGTRAGVLGLGPDQLRERAEEVAALLREEAVPAPAK